MCCPFFPFLRFFVKKKAAYEEDQSHELSDLAAWEKLCPVNGQYLCAVGVHLADPKKTMDEFAKQFAKDHLRFFHLAEASEHNDLFNHLRSVATGPSVLVVNRKREKMAIGSATKTFLDSLVSGSGKWTQDPMVK